MKTKQAERIINILICNVTDLKSRKIIWLRTNRACWKTIQKNVNLSRWQASRLYNKGILEISQMM